jgi:cell division protein YceG involved in septum cleavage
LDEIIIMASIVEKEATADSRDDVANILWKRFDDECAL